MARYVQVQPTVAALVGWVMDRISNDELKKKRITDRRLAAINPMRPLYEYLARELLLFLKAEREHTNKLQARNNGLQAQIDMLMLEYCPEEMTPEQKETWAKHQVPADEF